MAKAQVFSRTNKKQHFRIFKSLKYPFLKQKLPFVDRILKEEVERKSLLN